MEEALDTVDSRDKKPLDMQLGDWSVKEAASLMGVSEKTVRRHVKDTLLASRRQPGKYGEELRVTAIPLAMVKATAQNTQPLPQQATPTAVQTSISVAANNAPAPNDLDVKSLLEQRDRQLAELNQMLGAARLRISQLEAQVNLLELHNPRIPWWRRAWNRVTGRSGDRRSV